MRVVALVLAICLPIGSGIGVGSAWAVDHFWSGSATAQQDEQGNDQNDDNTNADGYQAEQPDADGPLSASDWKTFGACGLLNSEDLRWTTPASDSGLEVGPAARYTGKDEEAGGRSETCHYAPGGDTSGTGITVSETEPEFVDQGAETKKVPELGKGASFRITEYRLTLTAQHDDLYVQVTSAPPRMTGRKQSALRDSMVETFETVTERLPQQVTFPARFERELCADLDEKAVAKALDAKIELSRSLHTDQRQHCSFSSEPIGSDEGSENKGKTRVTSGNARALVNISVGSRPSSDQLRGVSAPSSDDSIDVVDGLDSYWNFSTLTLVDSERKVDITYQPGDPSADTNPPEPPDPLLDVARSVADIYDMQSPGPRKPAEDGPCGLLPETVTAKFSYNDDIELLPVARYVDSAGTVAADTCRYGTELQPLAPSRSELQVQVSDEHFEPFTNTYEEPERKPLKNLGDQAFVLDGTAEMAAVVRRGSHQLTIRAASLDPSNPADVEVLTKAARKANDRWKPGKVERNAASGPCAEVKPEQAIGSEVSYVRSLGLRPDHRCAFTTKNGEVVLVGLYRQMSTTKRTSEIDGRTQVDDLFAFSDKKDLLVLDEETVAGLRVAVWTPVDRGFETSRVGDRHTELGELFGDAFFDE